MKRSAEFSVSTAIDPRILDEAAHWLMQLHASTATEEDRAACHHWQFQSPEHARAWARAELLMNKLGALPASLAMPVLDRPASAHRRAALASIGKLAALLAVVPLSWSAWQHMDESGWTAEHQTDTGERRDVQLADGSRVTINTASAIDVQFDSTQRLILLRAGEILVQTAPDTVGIAPGRQRPFSVGTRQGRMQALGTRFTVRQTEGQTYLAVQEGAVRIEPNHGDTHILHAGQHTTFTATAIAPAEPADNAATAWTQGMLLADKIRLDDLTAELSRYRKGFLRCDAAIAGLLVSGAFPLMESDRALSMLTSTYPVAAQVRLGGLWVTLVSR